MTEDFYDNDWNHLKLKRPGVSNSTKLHAKPVNFDEMLSISKILSKNHPFIRVDFYLVDNRLYLGELTFYPAGGFDGYEPEEYDMILGKWLDLSNYRGK